MRKRRFILNTIVSLVNQLLLILSGFIVPRYMLLFYGSETNGLVSSISQFLGFISFMQAGVGAVVQSVLYKPLSCSDWIEVSKIYKSAQRFFRTIAYIFLGYTLIISLVYPFFSKTDYSHIELFVLVWAISVNLFAQYYFSISNTILLNADQKSYIPLIFSSITIILSVVTSVGLMVTGQNIITMKLITNIVCLVSPLGITLYVRKSYPINRNITYETEPIQQKWSGFAQHISAVIVENTDIIVLTLFSTLKNVSVYTVYNLVVVAVKQLLISTTAGVQALFGDMIAKGEMKELRKSFDRFELLFSFLTTFMYSSTITLIVPFVKVYTSGVTDANYDTPLFAVLISLAVAIFCYRTIYYTLIKAAGHFKETQIGAIIEVVINLCISIVAVNKFGLIGVAIGTCIAVFYRTVYCVWYLSKHLIQRPVILFVKNTFINIIVFLVCYLFSRFFKMSECTYISWLFLAIPEAMLNLLIVFIVYFIGYKKELLFGLNIIRSKLFH